VKAACRQARLGGEVQFAPGLVWAHTSCREGHHVAVLPLPLAEVPVGQVAVTVDGAALKVFFVVEESQYVDFFRGVIALEKGDEGTFKRLARSGFPAFGWADNVWRGFRRFSRPYIAVRDELVRYLSGPSDHGAACFAEFAHDPYTLADVLSARIGASTSDENGDTKRHPPSRQDRTRRRRGIDKVSWWHVKLQLHVDRIHFRWEPPSAPSAELREGLIVAGLFKDLCVLPN